MPLYPEIEDVLRKDLEDARKRLDEANLAFWHVASDINGSAGVSHDQQTQAAAKAQLAALEAVIITLKRFNDFLVNGAVPEPLRAEESRTAGQ